MVEDYVKEGDYVYLWHSEGINIVAKAKRGLVLSTVRGIIRFEDIVGKPYGSRIVTNLGHEFYLTKPTSVDILMKMPRVTQPIYPKDASALLVILDVKPGSRILEAGLGSGYAASILALHVGEQGLVVSVERNPRYIKAALSTLRELGVADRVHVVNGDVKHVKWPRGYFDAALLDMGDPWDALPNVAEALRHGGVVAVYVPTVSQVERVIDSMVKAGLIDVRMLDVQWRFWKAKPREVRPETWTLTHTGFIIYARRP
mgnify:FL=1